jgi:hypothetical protein
MAKLTLNKAILRLLLQLPTNIRKLWLTLEDLHGHLHDAGVDKDLAADRVEIAMKYDRTGMISQCMHRGCKYYLLFIKEEALFQAPVDQELRGTTASDSAKPKTFRLGYFDLIPECKESLDCVTNAIKAAKSQSFQMPKASGAVQPSKKASSPQTPAKANDTQTQEPNDAPHTPTANESQANVNHVTDSPTRDPSSSNPTSHIITPGPSSDETRQSSYKMMNEALDREWTQTVHEHAKKCRCSKLEFTKSKTIGLDVTDFYLCKGCGKEISKRSAWDRLPGSDDDNRGETKKTGPVESEVNRNWGFAVYKSGIGVKRALELAGYLGMHAPSERGMRNTERVIKDLVKPLAQAQLRENRLKHNKACREQANYKGDLTWVDKNGKLHSFARGPVCIDGAGDVRAYGHKITGSQHCFVIISLLTFEVVYLAHHQLSCQKCSMQMTRLMKERGRADISEAEITHPGVCYRNTTHTPATAEEAASESAGIDLLQNADGSYRDDSEAIFCDEIVSDGDTKGRNKIINGQVDIIGAAAEGKAEGFPSIEHLMKCISNGFYTLADKNSTLKGAGLLQPARIKSITSDVNTVIRSSSLCLQSLNRQETKKTISKDEAKVKRDAAHKQCLKDVHAIIPHHCGDHTQCSSLHCRYQQAKRALQMRKKMFDVNFEKDDLTRHYTNVARFKGKILGVTSLEPRAKLEKVISSRINERNIEKVCRVLTSNYSENFFQNLTKYSQGKRINLGQTDSWEVYQLFCAANLSNDKDEAVFNRRVQTALGIRDSEVRDVYLKKRKKEATQDADRKNSDEYRERKATTQRKKNIRLGREAAKKDRHKTEKMKPKDDLGNKRETKKRAPQKCGNCSELGHTARDCPEPRRMKATKNKAGYSDAEFLDMIDM